MSDKIAKVSVIIPAYNEETGIQNTLENLVAGNYHEKFAIIVVDDGSTDRTKEVCEKYPVTVYRHTVNKGYGAALKTGIRKATTDKVVFMDSDGQHKNCITEKDLGRQQKMKKSENKLRSRG